MKRTFLPFIYKKGISAITTKKAPVVEPKQSDEEFKQKVLAIVQEYADEDVDLVAVYEAAKQ